MDNSFATLGIAIRAGDDMAVAKGSVAERAHALSAIVRIADRVYLDEQLEWAVAAGPVVAVVSAVERTVRSGVERLDAGAPPAFDLATQLVDLAGRTPAGLLRTLTPGRRGADPAGIVRRRTPACRFVGGPCILRGGGGSGFEACPPPWSNKQPVGNSIGVRRRRVASPARPLGGPRTRAPASSCYLPGWRSPEGDRGGLIGGWGPMTVVGAVVRPQAAIFGVEPALRRAAAERPVGGSIGVRRRRVLPRRRPPSAVRRLHTTPEGHPSAERSISSPRLGASEATAGLLGALAEMRPTRG